MSPYTFKKFQQKVTKHNLLLLVKRFLIVAVSFFLALFLLNLIFPLPDKIEYSTIVTDTNGEIINAYLTRDQKWRMKTELNEISPLLRKTIIAKEDKYFYKHPGINLFSVARASVMNMLRMRRTSGASTITMQVARALQPRKRNFWSKLIGAQESHGAPPFSYLLLAMATFWPGSLMLVPALAHGWRRRNPHRPLS